MLVSAVDVWIGAEPLLSVRCLLLDQEMDLLVALQPQVLGSDLLAPWAEPLGLQVDCLIHPTLLLHQVLLHWAVPQTLRALLHEAVSPLTFLRRGQVCPVSLVFWAFAHRAKRAHTGLDLGVLSCLLVRKLRFFLGLYGCDELSGRTHPPGPGIGCKVKPQPLCLCGPICLHGCRAGSGSGLCLLR